MSFQSKTVIGGGGGLGAGFNRAEARSLNEVKESELGMGDKTDFFSTRATIVHIRGENVSYPACTGANCSKKMVMDGDTWVCDKCGHKAQSPEYRWAFVLYVPIRKVLASPDTFFLWPWPTGLVRLGSRDSTMQVVSFLGCLPMNFTTLK